MATKSKVAQIKDLKQGVTVYRVYALGEYSFIKTCHLTGKPYLGDMLSKCHDNLMVNIKGNTEKFDYFFLSDAGIIKQTYTNHQTFTTLRAAKRYQSHCIKYNVGVRLPY